MGAFNQLICLLLGENEDVRFSACRVGREIGT